MGPRVQPWIRDGLGVCCMFEGNTGVHLPGGGRWGCGVVPPAHVSPEQLEGRGGAVPPACLCS